MHRLDDLNISQRCGFYPERAVELRDSLAAVSTSESRAREAARYVSGTSFAAPQLAGLLATLLGTGHSVSAARQELRRATVATGCGVGQTFPVTPDMATSG